MEPPAGQDDKFGDCTGDMEEAPEGCASRSASREDAMHGCSAGRARWSGGGSELCREIDKDGDVADAKNGENGGKAHIGGVPNTSKGSFADDINSINNNNILIGINHNNNNHQNNNNNNNNNDDTIKHTPLSDSEYTASNSVSNTDALPVPGVPNAEGDSPTNRISGPTQRRSSESLRTYTAKAGTTNSGSVDNNYPAAGARSSKRSSDGSSASDDVERMDPKLMTLRQRMYLFLDRPFAFDRTFGGKSATIVNSMSITAIIASQVALCIETAPPYYVETSRPGAPWFEIECTLVAWFTLELLLRFLSSPSRAGFVRDALNVCDVLAVVPFYVEIALSTSFSFNFKVFRLLRVIRIVKISRFHAGLITIARAVDQTWRQLLMGLALLLTHMFLCSSAMFYVERASSLWSPTEKHWYFEKDVLVTVENGSANGTLGVDVTGDVAHYIVSRPRLSPFQTLLHTFWWCIATLTTVGYGDAVPQSSAGKVVAAFTMVSGVVILSLPASIIGSKFLELYKARETNTLEHSKVEEKEREQREIVDVLVFVAELEARGKLSATTAYLHEDTGELVTKTGDAEEIRAALFDERFSKNVRSIFNAAKAGGTADCVVDRFVRNVTEFNLQKRFFVKPSRTAYHIPWAPSPAAMRMLQSSF
ncbi:Potassium voltage-gated channel protein Shaker [Diplonema papillatum]|nr:Potassium voltage-gated channel protein Shaker [Diplonema papillatum]|eukprot:gene15865-24243_t